MRRIANIVQHGKNMYEVTPHRMKQTTPRARQGAGGGSQALLMEDTVSRIAREAYEKWVALFGGK